MTLTRIPDPSGLSQGWRRRSWVIPAAFFVAMSSWRFYTYFNFGTGFDTALLGNVIWRVAHGLDTQTAMTGGHYISTHLSPLSALWLPAFKWLPLDLAMLSLLGGPVLAAAALVWCVGVLARHVGLDTRASHLLQVAVALSPGAFLMSQFEIHETTIGLGPLAVAIVLAVREAHRWQTWTAAGLAVAARIEIAASVFVVGIILWSIPRYRKGSTAFLVLGASSILLYVGWLLMNPFPTESVAAHFGHLGNTPTEVLQSVIARPASLLGAVVSWDLVISISFWLLAFGLLPTMARPRWILIGLPSAAIAFLGTWSSAEAFIHHYWYPTFVGVAFATVWGFGALEPIRMRLGFFLCGGFVLSWILLAPVMGFFVPQRDQHLSSVLVAVRETGAQHVAVPAELAARMIDRSLVIPLPRPFACAEEGIGPYTAPGEPPDILVLRDGFVDHLGGAERTAAVRLLRSYDRIHSSGDVGVWQVVDPLSAARDYRPCSRNTVEIQSTRRGESTRQSSGRTMSPVPRRHSRRRPRST